MSNITKQIIDFIKNDFITEYNKPQEEKDPYLILERNKKNSETRKNIERIKDKINNR